MYFIYSLLINVVFFIERPIHYTETVVDVTMRWARWPEDFRRSNYLCITSANIYQSIDAVVSLLFIV